MRQKEMTQWKQSFRANIRCAMDMEAAIHRNGDAADLPESCVREVLETWGYQRTAFVLAANVREHAQEGGFSEETLAWSRKHCIPREEGMGDPYAIHAPLPAIDSFAALYRRAYQELGLFDARHCEPNSFSELDYEGKVLVLSSDTLRESYWTPEAQLWLAHDGFGCSPRAIGRSIRCTCLGDGETTRWNRAEFIGVIKDEFLPGWAREKLEELSGQRQSDAPTMNGMTMK